MITQEEFQRHRDLRGKFVNYWLDGSMTTDELQFMIERVSNKIISEPKITIGVDVNNANILLCSLSQYDHIMVRQP